MNSTQMDVHVNQPLSNFSLMFEQEADSFVADKVFPVVPSEKQSNLYYAYERGDFNRVQVKERAAGTESEGGGYNLNANASFYAKVFALHKDIADQVRSNADSQLNPDLEATRFLTMQMLIKKETDFVAGFMVPSVWSTNKVGTNDFVKWSSSSSKPIEDVRGWKRDVQLASGGYRPNTLVLGRAVYDALLDNAEIVPRIQYSVKEQGNAALVTRNVLAQLFEVESVVVMDAIQNTAVEGATESNAFIAGSTALLAYVTKTPSLMSATAGFTVGWTGQFGASAIGGRMLSYYMPWLASTRVEIESAYCQKLVAADLAAFASAVI